MPTVLVIDDAYLGQVLEVLGVRGGRTVPVRAITSAAAAPTWAEVLAHGAESGPIEPVVSTGVRLVFSKLDPDGWIQALGGTLLVQSRNTNDVGVPASNLDVFAGTAARDAGGRLRLRGGAGGLGLPGGNVEVQPGNGTGGGGANGVVETRNGNGILVETIADGGVAWGAGVPALSPAVVGARGGNAALASLLTTLAGMGLITDNTTP